MRNVLKKESLRDCKLIIGEFKYKLLWNVIEEYKGPLKRTYSLYQATVTYHSNISQ